MIERDDALLRRVLRAENLASRSIPEVVPSESNEVWRVGELFVRICYRGDRGRLLREAAVASELPLAIGYPEVLAVGRDEFVSWMITRAVDATPVSEVFPLLNERDRVRIGRKLGELLRIVHVQSPPNGIDDRPNLDITGEDVYPLPIWRARTLVQDLAAAGRIDASLAGEVITRLEEHAFLDPFASSTCLVHCDAGIENLLWRDGEVVALVDFEWSRGGQSWVDVLPFVIGGNLDVARGLRDAYAEPFLMSQAAERIYLLELVAAIRTAVLWNDPSNVKRLEAFARSPEVRLQDKARQLLG